MIPDEAIEQAKCNTRYTHESAHHEHNDCIRIAYEWLDAQKKTKGFSSKQYPLKHLIEKWAGRYVSTSDVDVAAYLHPEISGSYPFFNISARLIEPSINRLHGLAEAFTHSYRERHDPSTYKVQEE